MRNALHGRRPGANDADAFTAQAGEIAIRITTGVRVVPAAGMECVALESLNALDTRQLETIERAVRHRDKARVQGVPAISADAPASRILIPCHVGDFGLQQRLVVEPIVLRDFARIRQNLRRMRVLLARHVVHQSRHG